MKVKEEFVHLTPEALVQAAGLYWAISNSGQDPERIRDKQTFVSQFCDTDEVYDGFMQELKYWTKEAQKALPKLQKSSQALSIKNLWESLVGKKGKS